MIDEFKAFIEVNRIRDSKTELAWAALRSDGYLVVGDNSVKRTIVRRVPSMDPNRIFTVYELRDGKGRGLDPRPVFMDTSCFGGNVPQDPIMEMKLGELIERAKAKVLVECGPEPDGVSEAEVPA